MSETFDLLGPLPTGTTVLEASAGTGKTYTIAGLVTRFVAEGHARLDELLVITFGRLATLELRDRVRARLVSARDGLADLARARTSDDDLLVLLAGTDDSEAAVRRRRLAEALASFDSATVATTHEFCHQVLHGLGTAGDVDSGAALVENLDDLTVEVAQDLYLRKWARDDAQPPEISYKDALALARAVVNDSQAVLVPGPGETQGASDVRRRFADAVRAEVDRRKRAQQVLSFDDILTRLRATLADEGTGAAAAQRLRSRYKFVLVDEFQDTDPVQWQIVRLAFHGHATLVLIGDPKQAIYAFRGADVHAYLDAKLAATQQATLGQNWRSDADLLRGLDALFRGAVLGDDLIRVAPVEAAYDGRCLDVGGAPVRIRAVRAAADVPVTEARRDVTADLVAEIVELLDSRAQLTPRGGHARPVEPGDLAVVVRTNVQLELVHTALLAAGVPAVQRTTSSVFGTQAGRDWIALLEALEQPHRSVRLRRLAVTAFVGWDAAQLESGDVDGLGLRLRYWLRVYTDRGIAALLETVSRDEKLASRLLGQLDGERRLTDLRHVGESLHAAAMADGLGLTATLEWLRRRVDEAADDNAPTERSRRLDSDAAAVQVMTIWASKGLEFPIVYVPFAWDRHVGKEQLPLFHDPQRVRTRHVGGYGSPGFSDAQRRHRSEQLGEDLRLLYVAMTRAQAQVTAWWAPGRNAKCAPVHRLLLTDEPHTGIPETVAVPAADVALPRLAARAVDGVLSVTEIELRAPARWSGTPASPGALEVARLGRSVDEQWRRTSYSALTYGVHEQPPVSSEADVAEKDDEPETPTTPVTGDVALQAVASPMADLAGGAAFGTLVHSVLERVDTTADDLDLEVRTHVAAQVKRSGPADVPIDELATGLMPSLLTPMGPLAGGLSLAEIAPRDRLAELDFELPLRGGDRPNGVSVLRDIAQLLRDHLPADDPLLPYAELLEDPVVGDGVLRGYLTGSIDSVLRIDGRYVIVDYKTNRLGDAERPLTAWDYRTDAMAEAMLHAHYPLQALLYAVALHRFLRWRLGDYDPRRHLGGVLYLFLRGMCGPGVRADDGSVPGVFAWHPPAALVLALSDALATGVAA